MKRNSSIWNSIFGTSQNKSAVKGVEFVRDRQLYIVLRDRRFNIFVLNEHVTTAEKSDDK